MTTIESSGLKSLALILATGSASLALVGWQLFVLVLGIAAVFTFLFLAACWLSDWLHAHYGEGPAGIPVLCALLAAASLVTALAYRWLR